MVNSKQYAETTEERYKRYKAAYNRRLSYWDDTLEDIYTYCIPGRNNWQTFTPGESKTTEIFDDTAVMGVQNFSTNVLTYLIPPFKQFMHLSLTTIVKNSGKFSDSQLKQIDEYLQTQIETLFEYLNESGYANAFHEAFQDLAAGTGVILINEGNDLKPFNFAAIPLSEIAVEEGATGKLENFWRTKKYCGRKLERIWPQIKLTEELATKVKNSPDEEIEIIEGVICYPNNSEEERYFYYVQTSDGKNDLYSDFRAYCPFIGFRFSKCSGEEYGRGPANFAIDFVRILNLLAEYDLRSAKFDAFNAYTIASTNIINPNTAYLEPGALIPIDSQFVGQDPIKPIPINQNRQSAQMRIQEYQAIVNNIFASEPLVEPQDAKQITATEANIRYKEWVRKNSSSALRLQDELVIPLFSTLLKILRKKALIKDIRTHYGTAITLDSENGVIKLIYDSPLMDVQNDEDLQAMDNLLARCTTNFGQAGILATKFKELPQFWAEKLNADMTKVESPDSINNTLGKMLMNIQQQQQQQQQQPQQTSAGVMNNAIQQQQ